MSGKRVLIVLFAVAAGGFVYPLAAQQGPPIPQPNPAASQPAPGANEPSPNQPAAPVPGRPGVVPRQAPSGPIPGAPVPPTGPLSQPDPSAVPPGEQAPPAQPSAPGSQPGSGPVSQGRRALQPPPVTAGGMVSLNFNRADLIEIIHIIAQQLRLTYTIDPEVKGTVTINSAEPLRSEDLLPIFHQLLRMNGAVAVRTGNLYHIMPIKDGKGLARPVGQNREDSFALQIIPVRFFAVAEMKKVLTPFLQPGAEIIENPRGNFLVVMDLSSNIQRLMEIAEMIDVQVFAGTRMEIYQPKVASAEELSQEMIKIMQSFAASAPQTDTFSAQFIPLPRINQLLVISNSEAAWTYARRWLERIDVVAEGPGRRIFIYAVENGKATELADVLSQALGQPASTNKSSAPTLQDIHRSTAGGGTNPATGRNTMGSGSGSSFGSSSSNSFGQQRSNTGGSAFAAVPVPGQVPTAPGVSVTPQSTPPQAPAAPRPAGQAPQAQQPQQPPEQLRIVPDPATNSLIIYGTAQEFQNIKNILKDLDAIPRQVLIEAMVLQVDLSDSESLGVDFEIFRGSRTIFGGEPFTSRGAFRTLGDLFPVAPGFGASSGLSGIVGGQDLRAMIRVLATDSRVKLISSPSVMAADNRPARIQVGTEEPVPTGTISQAVGGVAQSTSIQYRNTGRILTIIPQVNSQGLVNLQIKAEVSARGELVAVGPDTFPSFNTQDAETTAVVHDGDSLVIGGLIGERRSKTRNGIPYLMDIPVFGRFFGTTSDNNQRTELIMLITPRVVRTRAESVVVTDEFLSKLSTARTELERIARDQEKTRPKPAPNQAPPMPVPPPAYDPAPAPDSLPPGPGASIAPLIGNAVAPSGRATAQVAVAAPIPVAAREAQVQPLSVPARPVEIPPIVAQTKPPRATTEPAYALSVVKQKVEMPKISMAKAAEAAVRPAASKVWTVQVASSVAQKEAEKLANQLRNEGYNAYVAVAEIGTKTWHRVRIGELKSISEAMELRRALINSRSFETAYIALR